MKDGQVVVRTADTACIAAVTVSLHRRTSLPYRLRALWEPMETCIPAKAR